MAPWRTYGRHEETADLERWCTAEGGFMAGVVLGRRGVGKTQLLEDVQARLRGRCPMVIFELPVRPDQAERRGVADGLREDIDEAVADPDIAPLLADLAPREPNDDELVAQISRIMRITRHCLLKGAVVGIDEFHNARPLGLESALKRMIDKAGRHNNGPWPGKLVVAGSHQQQLIDMIGNPGAPLYERFMHEFRLRPLKAPALLEMAAEQGWLADSRLFLTLNMVFGGMPRHWERFYREQATLPPPGAGFPDWRAAFLAREIKRLEGSPTEKWDWKGWVEIEPVTRSILEIIVSRNFRGTLKSVIAETCRPADVDRNRWPDELERRLSILESHLELAAMIRIPGQEVFPPKASQKIRITDATTLFQMLVLGNPKANRPPVLPEAAATHPALMDAEGVALEPLTAEWLEGLPGWEKVMANVQPGSVEIDVLGLTSWDPAETEWMALCSCKRSAARHDPVREERRMQAFLGEIEIREGWRRPPDGNVRKALVSPVFDAADRERLADCGFRLVGIRRMARKLGFDPGPRFDPDPVPAPQGHGSFLGP